jgi:hypothetical protein
MRAVLEKCTVWRMRSVLRIHLRGSGVKKTMGICARIAVAVLVIFFAGAASAPALTLNLQSIGGNPPENALGGGNLDDIVKAAAHLWESAYSDSLTVTLYYGWAQTGDAGTHTLIAQGDVPNRELCGRILFDNSGSTPFYLDPTPYSNEEYLRFTEEFQNLGGGHVNVARIYGSPAGAASGHVDLLSVVLHEMGHALGLSATNLSFIEQSGSGVINIVGSLPYKGTMVPLAYNNTGIIPHFDVTELAYGSVMAGVNGDERRIPSELDILANAQISSFSIRNLRPQQADPSDSTEIDGTVRSRRVPTSSGISGGNRTGRIKGLRGVLRNSQSITMQ